MKKTCFLFPYLLLLFIRAPGQDAVEPKQLTHWMSPDEMLKRHEIGLGFVETAPPVAPVRNVAEFDYMQGVLVRYPFGIPVSLIREMAEDVMVTTIVNSASQQNSVIQQYINSWVDTSHCNFLIAPSNSYWTRDYGPWFASDSANNMGIVDFPYNRPQRPDDDEIPKKVADMLGIPWFGMRLTHTGGNYMTDGLGISSSTTLIWEENPSLTHQQVAQKVHDYLGIENYIVQQDPNGTYIDHIDCWGKFLAPDKILIRKVPPTHARYAAIEAVASFYASQVCSYGYPYRVFRVNTPEDQPYTNSLILNNKVLVPIMNSNWDDSALAAYQAAMPGYQVLGFLSSPGPAWQSTDALHCRAIGIADIGLLYIRHIPLSGNQPAQDNFIINADLIPCSDSAIYNDSVRIHYKVGNGSFKVAPMINPYGYHYTGTIPKQPSGSMIKYYLHAADKSGRHATAPFIGPADPFTFTSVYTDVTAIPDTLWFSSYEECLNGKITTLHNYTSSGININYIEETGIPVGGGCMWYIEPMPITNYPYLMNPGDSVQLRVKFTFPVNSSRNGYVIDTLHFISAIDTHRVILLISDSLLTKVRNGSRFMDMATLACYPNPFTTETNIRYSADPSTSVRIEIFDLQGRTIKTLHNGPATGHNGTIIWKATDDNGNRVPEGIYLCRLTTKDKTITKRLVVIR